MEGTFHYMLMAEQAMVQKHILRTLRDTGLTMGQPKVLEYLMEHDGAEQKEIAMGCHVEAPSLTSILNRMERDGLISPANGVGKREILMPRGSGADAAA